MKPIFLILLFFLSLKNFSQEILAEVNVDHSQIQTSKIFSFVELQKSLKNFINTTQWTKRNLKAFERIQVSFSLIITEQIQNNTYKAQLLVQSRRPVYHSDYFSPIVNLTDNDFTFKYIDFQPLIFNQRKFSGTNLTDVIAFYIYYILGADADTFRQNGGKEWYEMAQQITNNSQNQDFSGWSRTDGIRNRFTLVNSTLASQNTPIRLMMYQYHRKGLDIMHENQISAKKNIGNALLSLDKLIFSNNYTQNYFLDNVLQAKNNEIAQIFSGGEPAVFPIGDLRNLLHKIAPNYSDSWEKLNK